MSTEKSTEFDWSDVIQEISPYLVKVMTPAGSGTGFLVGHTKSKNVVGIATAAHFVQHAFEWRQPIRISHATSSVEVFLTHEDRAILTDLERDTGSVIFAKAKIPFPEEPLPLIEKGYHLKIGNEVGWLGYPAMASANLCFFSGRLSCWMEKEGAYLVDGVAINGVSGGPVFFRYRNDKTKFIGFVSAYVPNIAAGTPLPGVSIIRGVSALYEWIQRL